MLWTVPNILTWIRIAAIPLIVLLFYAPYHWADPAAGLLFAGCGHYGLAGWLPRPTPEPDLASRRVPRPVADKLIVAVALVLFISKELPPEVPSLWHMSLDRARMLLALTAVVIIGREIAISALREWMAELGQRAKVAVSVIGKFKTILQIIGLSMMLFRWDLLGLPIFSIGFLFTVVAAAFTLLSAFSYLRAAWPELRRH